MNKKQQHNTQDTGEVVLVDVNESAEVEVQKTPDEPAALPGHQLAALRQAKHLSIEDVSGFLKLATRQVIAIENDDYNALPGSAVTRGFFRSYAKMLGTDPAPLLAALPAVKMPVQDTTPAPNIDARPFEMNWPLKRRSFAPKLLIGLVVIAAIGGIGSYAFDKVGGLRAAEESLKEAELPAQDAAADADQTAASENVNTDGSLLNKVNTPASTAEAAPAADAKADNAAVPAHNADQPAAKVTDELNVNKQADTEQAAPAVPAQETVPAVVNGKNAFQMTASGDSWVEARKVSDDTVVFSKLMHSGEVASFEVSEPLQVVIGNASGIAATLRGQPFSLSGSKNNVARLILK